MLDNKLEMNNIERQAEETIKNIEKSIVPLLHFSFFIGTLLIFPFIFLFLDFLGFSRNEVLIFTIILIATFFLICFFISYIEEKKFKKILKNNEEYRLAKEIMEKYNKKVLEIEEKEAIERKNIQYKATLEREKEKTERMIKMKEYLKGSES